MRIGSSVFLGTLETRFARTSRALQQSLERLSSGRRINSAKDDVAGFSMDVGLEARVRGATQAIRNVNDGQSMLMVADSALNDLTNILQSMRELAVQAASGTLSSADRSAINDQVSGLLQEYERITSQTVFNGIELLNGNSGPIRFQAGSEEGNIIAAEIGNLSKDYAFTKTVGTGAFTSPKMEGLELGTYLLSSADLNGDGKKDAVVGCLDSLTTAILIGNGDGTFRKSILTNDILKPGLVDVNGDGIIDIVSAYQSDSALGVWIGNGDGTFKPRVSYGGGTIGTPLDQTIGDLDGNGTLDVAVAVDTASYLAVFLNNGDGTFVKGTSCSIPAAASRLAAADMNHDGKLDLVESAGSENGVAVLFGNGDGTFRPAVTYATSGNAQSIQISDLNDDGNSDVIIAEATGVFVYLGNSDGTLKAERAYGGAAGAVALGDLNGDGVLDIGVSPIEGKTQILMGNGDGSFRLEESYTCAFDSYALVIDDFTGDGVSDLLFTSYSDSLLAFQQGLSHEVTALSDLALITADKAGCALNIIDTALKKVTSERGSIGSVQQRLELSADRLFNEREGLSKVLSDVMDVDIAHETAELVRNQILQQVGVSVLAQANLMQSRVLDLLKF